MHKLRRFFYQNKYQILRILGIIIFIIIIIQLMNLFARRNTNKKITEETVNTTVTEPDKGLLSDKSAVTGQELSEKQLNNEVTVIHNFIEYCNKQDFENAYKLLTEDCKKSNVQ